MKVNVDFKILDLNDKPLEEKANRFMADILVSGPGDPLKVYELAMKINKSKKIDIDTTDLKLIEDAVKSTQKYNNLVKGAILKEIESQKVSAKAE